MLADVAVGYLLEDFHDGCHLFEFKTPDGLHEYDDKVIKRSDIAGHADEFHGEFPSNAKLNSELFAHKGKACDYVDEFSCKTIDNEEYGLKHSEKAEEVLPLGIRTQRDAKDEMFMRYWQLVQDEAKKQGMVFFLEAGDGNEFELEDMEGEDLSGWLVPIAKAEEFRKLHTARDDGACEDFEGVVSCFAEWKIKENELSIEFKTYPMAI